MAKKKPYRFFLYLLLRMISWPLVWMPDLFVGQAARFGGGVAWRLVSRQRQKAIQHLRMAYGSGKSLADIQKLGRRVFESFAVTGIEILRFSRMTRGKIEKLVDGEKAVQVYNELLAEGRGLISVTAHLGNWELLAGYFGMKGYRGAVLAKRLYYEPYNRWIVGLRQALKVPTLYRDDASREILKRLKAGEIIGLLPDQDIDSLKGVFVDFFGRPAYTPVAPARLSLASGAPILPNFMVRQENGKYQIVVGQVIRPDLSEDRDSAARRMTENWMRQFEEVIRRFPGQWAWVHNRWKTQPQNKEKKEETVTSL